MDKGKFYCSKPDAFPLGKLRQDLAIFILAHWRLVS